MTGAVDDVELLLAGKVDEFDGIARDADGEVGILRLFGVFHCVYEFFGAEDIYVEVVCAFVKVSVKD